MVDQNSKMIVVACNTASSLALDYIKSKFDLPIIGVIEPGIHSAISITKNKRVGILGTNATIQSDAYGQGLRAMNDQIAVISQACPLFVPLAEEGWVSGSVPTAIATTYLEPITRSNVDTLILGCTHYPLFKNIITQIINPNILIIDSAKETARCVLEHLSKKQLLSKENKSTDKYYVSDKPEKFDQLANMFLGIKDINVNHIRL